MFDVICEYASECQTSHGHLVELLHKSQLISKAQTSGKQEKRFNDQLRKTPENFSWMGRSQRNAFRRVSRVTARNSQSVRPLSSLQFHPISCKLTCGHEYAKHLLQFSMAPFSPRKATDSHLRHEWKVDPRNGGGDLGGMFCLYREVEIINAREEGSDGTYR